MPFIKSFLALILLSVAFTSCQAIGNIFSAGVWVGAAMVIIVIIILFAVFRKRS